MNQRDRLRYIPLDASDWLDSDSVARMSFAAQGVYVRLLCLAWRRKMDLPDDPKRLAELTCVPPATFKKLWPEIEPCWQKHDGRLVNERLQDEYRAAVEKVEKMRQQRVDAGKASGKSRGNEAGNDGSTGSERPFNDRSNDGSTNLNDITKLDVTQPKTREQQHNGDAGAAASFLETMNALIAEGIDPATASRLAGDPDTCRRQLAALRQRKGVKNRAAFLVRAIERKFKPPVSSTSVKKATLEDTDQAASELARTRVPRNLDV